MLEAGYLISEKLIEKEMLKAMREFEQVFSSRLKKVIIEKIILTRRELYDLV